MKTKKLIAAFVAAVLSSSGVYAQKVEAALWDGHPVINCEGMPSSTYTTTSKGNTQAQLRTKAADEKVYKRFAVSNIDHPSYIFNRPDITNWNKAFTQCSSVGVGWRVPTVRELVLIWILRTQLEQKSGFTALRNIVAPNNSNPISYYSATEGDPGHGYTVYMDTGVVYFGVSVAGSDYDPSLYYASGTVRCIREL